MKKTIKKKQNNKNHYFLLGVIIIFIMVILFKPDALMPSLKFFIEIIKKVILIFFLVFILLVIVNRFVTQERLLKYFGKHSGIKGWIVAIAGGIISMGPPFLWYPLLNDLKKQGVRTGLIATFLYNRAVKPALLPLMIFYFGLIYTIVLAVVMMIISVFQGLIVEKIVGVKK